MNAPSIQPALLLVLWLYVVAAGFFPCPVNAQEEKKPDAGLAITTTNPSIPVDELELGLKPLDKIELANEAEGWLTLLKATAFLISATEIAVQRKNTEIDELEALAELVDEVRQGTEHPKSEGSDPEDSNKLIHGRIRKIAELQVRETADDAVASVIRSATERARQASLQQDTGNNAPESTGTEELVDLKNLEELHSKVLGMALAKESVRAMLFEDVDTLRAARSALIERLQTVLGAWKMKGGEAQDYELYIEAVDDVDVDIADATTAWTTLLDWIGSWVEEVTDRLSGAAFDIVIVILIALAIWTLIEHKLNTGNPLAEEEEESEAGGLGGTRGETVRPLIRIFIKIILVVMVVFISLSSLGVNIGPLIAGVGVVGLAIGFGAQTLVRDIVSGFFYLIDDAFRIGEYVVIDQIRGTVEKISIRSFQLRHHNGPVHTIPYGEIRTLTNWSRDWAIMKFELRIAFETDINQVRKIIKQIGVEMYEDPQFGQMMLAPLKSQGVNRMEDSALIIRCKFTSVPGQQFLIRREAFTRIQKAFEEKGIHFAQRRVVVEASTPTEAANTAAAVIDQEEAKKQP